MRKTWGEESVAFDKVYLGETWSSRVPFLGPFIRQGLIARHQRALYFVKQVEAATILDLGCGVGRFASEAAQQGIMVYGYDISAEAVKVAQENAHRQGLSDKCTFIAADLHEVDFPPADAWFDLGCLNYLTDPQIIVAKLTHIKHFFSCLPMKGHWLGPLHFIYRTLLKGQSYQTFSRSDVINLFGYYGKINIEQSGMVYYITTRK